MTAHGCWGFAPESLILPVVQRLAADAYRLSYFACAPASGAQIDHRGLLLLFGARHGRRHIADNVAPRVGHTLMDPGTHRRAAGVTERRSCLRCAPTVIQVVLDGDALLLIRIPRLGAYVTESQVM